MNYLAHIHLAAITDTSMIGNFAGDFVRGSNLQHLTEEVRKGVQLHRSIDSFTDKHEQVRALKQQFPRSLKRTAGICLDIWFDHLLLHHNHQFRPSLQDDILGSFYQELASFNLDDARFNKVKRALLTHRWLSDYVYEETCLQAFKSIEVRLGHRITFASASFAFMQQNRQEMEQGFLAFYPELIDYCSRQAR